jgi:hypothetical protein
MTEPDVNSPVPIEYVLESDRRVHVANVELGITFYLADPVHWAQKGAADALQRFVQLAPQDFLLWYTTSLMDVYKRAYKNTLHEVIDAFSVHWLGQLRQGFEFILADDVGSECTGFRYVEIDPKRVERTSLLELTIPAHFDPKLLLQMADMVFSLGPVYCAIGGYALRYNPAHRGTAFTVGRNWAKRYLGMDMQDRERAPWLVKDKLPGVNWLNYVGEPWLQASGLDLAALQQHAFTQPISITRTPAGARILAGDLPTLADLNHFQRPQAYEELARALAAYFPPEPSPLYGDFLADKDAGAWFRRYIEPDKWT